MDNYETTIHFRIDGGGIFELKVDLATLSIGMLKDRLVALGRIASRDYRLCRIDHAREVEMTMKTSSFVKDYFGGENYPNLDPNVIHIVIKPPPSTTTTSVSPATDK